MSSAPPRSNIDAWNAGTCSCGKVPFPQRIDPGCTWTCPCGLDRLSIVSSSAESRAATAEAEVGRLKTEVEAWKRVAVIAAVPLEAMRMAGSYRMLAPTTQTMVDEAVVTIRMAVAGHSLPPEGDIDTGLAPARTALGGTDA